MEKAAVSATVSYWVSEIETYERLFQDWEKKSKEIINRYKDERKGAAKNKARFNVLWSNVQTLSPALYTTPPKVNVDRRFQDDDDLGRYSALVLERAASYFVNHDVFDEVMRQMVFDRLLCGRGTSWVRYVPVFDESTQVTDDQEQELMYEEVIPDYVHWRDFGHTFARTWQEVRGVWRIVYLSRAELVKRFGEDVGNMVPLDAKRDEDKDKENAGKKATVYEIWDKFKKKAVWVHKSMDNVLDERDDPLKLKDFFPCPKPVYATLTNDDLIPVPDYVLYQDQARELDVLTGRIDSITKVLKVAGVYAANAEGVERLLNEGLENKLVPVDQWAAFAEKGGLAGVFSLLPMQEIMQTLVGLYDARDRVKNDLYEVTGISDVIRGATKASETATAQQLKGQYAGLRLDSQQRDVARIARDMVRIMTEIIAEHFSIDTIKQLSGVKLLSNVEKQILQAQLQGMQEAQQQIPGPMQEQIELLTLPSWEDIEGVIRNDASRCFRVDIETDSTVKTDQEAEKAARVEFLTAASQFMGQMQQIQDPDVLPLAMEMLMFGVRGFKVSRELETTFDTTIEAMKKKLEAPQPNPMQAQAQADQQAAQAQAQQQAQLEQNKAALEQQRLSNDASLKNREIDIKQQEIQMKNKELDLKFAIERMNIEVEKIRLLSEKNESVDVEESGVEESGMKEMAILDALNRGMQEIAAIQAQGNAAVVDAIQNPATTCRPL